MKLVVCISVLLLSVIVSANDLFLGEDNEPGFIDLGDGMDMFYWLFRARNKPQTPSLMLFFNGGPGCSSVYSVFIHNGPFRLLNPTTLVSNPWSWNNYTDIVYIDQPVGVGFSRCEKRNQYPKSEEEIAKTIHLFYQLFVESHPEYKDVALTIGGHSYGGHFAPAIASYFVKQSINVKGVTIGNGWVEPEIQFGTLAKFAYDNELISNTQYVLSSIGYHICKILLRHKFYILGGVQCRFVTHSIVYGLFGEESRFDKFDIRRTREHDNSHVNHSDVKYVAPYLAQQHIAEALGTKNRTWIACSSVVPNMLAADSAKGFASDVEELLKAGVEVVVYYGDQDFFCNWKGGEEWVEGMQWKGARKFRKTHYQDWTIDGKAVGQYRASDNLTFIRVFNAGHIVPEDLPEVGSILVRDFYFDKKY